MTEDREVRLQKQPTKVLCFPEDLETARRLLLEGGKEMNDKATRWENVKGRARYIYDKMAPIDFEGGGPYPPGAEFAMALCEEMDRMQEEFDRLKAEVGVLVEHNLKRSRLEEEIGRLRDMLIKHVSYKAIRRYDVEDESEEPKE